MLALLFGLIFFVALAVLLTGSGGLATEDLILLYGALGLFVVIAALATLPSLQSYRYRKLVARGLGISQPAWWQRVTRRQKQWAAGVAAGMFLIVGAIHLGKMAFSPNGGAGDIAPAPAQTAPTAAAPPVPAAAIAAPAQDDPAGRRQEVENAMRHWARAWSERNPDAYLAMYSPAFSPPDGLSRKEWEKLRRQRIENARDIAVSVEDTVVRTLGPDRVEATFVQNYAARGIKERSRKTLTLGKASGQWTILSEHSVPMPAGNH